MKPREMSSSVAASLGVQVPEGLGESEAFLEFQQKLSRAARVHRPVLIVGERGSGKELAASRLHYLSARWQGPLIALNCAALAPSLLETELFGHERGAFTGADHLRAGRFEAAHEGTLFLDEIGLIPKEVQEKILRAIEYGVFERVGSSTPIRVEVRMVGATNADLPSLVSLGRFKADLLDRLAFEVIHVPSLRDRQGDVMLLAHHFAVRMANEVGWADIPSFTQRAIHLLESYPWPGNVRELKNVVERAVYRSDSSKIDQIDFDPFQQSDGCAVSMESDAASKPASERKSGLPAPGSFKLGVDRLSDFVRSHELAALRDALAAARFHQGEAAKLLGLTYHQFRALYKKYKTDL